ncbi:hypothetical protein VCS63_24790 [Achromobacter sp. D10]|nr:hypothetical protein [Achromobacter sp. D10]MEB3099079.1 hypothetical protein [Achromobacter sp. D10]
MKKRGIGKLYPWEAVLREFVMWSTDMALYATQALAFALPILYLLGIAVHVRPNRFGALGSEASRKWFAVAMVAVWAFAAVAALLAYYVARNYDRGYGYFLFFLPYYLGPALILSVIGLWVRYRLCKG